MKSQQMNKQRKMKLQDNQLNDFQFELKEQFI